MSLVKEDDGLGDPVKANWESARIGEAPTEDTGARSAGENDEGFGEGSGATVFGGLKDFVVGEKVANRESLASIEIDVAVVLMVLAAEKVLPRARRGSSWAVSSPVSRSSPPTTCP